MPVLAQGSWVTNFYQITTIYASPLPALEIYSVRMLILRRETGHAGRGTQDVGLTSDCQSEDFYAPGLFVSPQSIRCLLHIDQRSSYLQHRLRRRRHVWLIHSAV
jgi:hypothetical protein